MAGMLEMKAATTVSHWPPLFTPLQTASGAAIEALQSNPPPQLQAQQRTNLPETQSPSAQVFSLGAQTHTHSRSICTVSLHGGDVIVKSITCKKNTPERKQQREHALQEVAKCLWTPHAFVMYCILSRQVQFTDAQSATFTRMLHELCSVQHPECKSRTTARIHFSYFLFCTINHKSFPCDCDAAKALQTHTQKYRENIS